jgi:hypothetical protein
MESVSETRGANVLYLGQTSNRDTFEQMLPPQGSVRSLLLRAVSSDIQLGHSPVEVQERSAMLQEHQAQKKLPGRSQ